MTRPALTFGLWLSVRCVQVQESSFLSQQRVSSVEEADDDLDLDGIIVLGGGLTEDGLPKEWVVPRLQEALSLYKTNRGPAPSGSPYIICSGASSANLEASVVTEAEACARYLMEHNVAPGDILEEPLARDTDGNAYFSRRLHTDVLNLHKLAVVTSEFQMARTEVIFRHVFSLKPLNGHKYNLSFASTANRGVEKVSLEARAEKEHNSTIFYEENVANITTLSDYHRFMFGDHMAYASERLFVDGSKPLDKDLKGTYVEGERDPQVEAKDESDAQTLPPLYGYPAKL